MTKVSSTFYTLRFTFLAAWVLAILFSLGTVVGSVKAQGASGTATPTPRPIDNLDTNLARAAATSFLITLTRPELAGTMNFYLTEAVKGSNILAGLQNPLVTDFEITASGWTTAKTYQVQATLKPDGRQVAVYSSKHDGRWLVEGIDLLLPTVSTASAKPGGVVTSTQTTVKPVVGNGSGKLVFQTQSGGGIYVINADGTSLRYLANGIDPQLSPDGKQVVFTRWEPNYEVFTINIDGTGEKSWAKGWRQMKSPTWAADGASLIFSWQSGGRLNDEKQRIDLAKAAQNEQGVNVPAGARDVEVEDGILKYRLPADAYWNLKRVDLTTGQLQDMAAGQYAYSPTGHPTNPKEFIYTFGGSGLAMLDAAANTARPVTAEARDRAPVISPDGQRMAVSYWQDGNWEIYVMNLDGNNRQRLTSTPITAIAEKTQLKTEFVDGKARLVPGESLRWNNAAPAWSPDGQQLAFLTDRSGQWEIWIMNTDGSNPRPMFPNGALNDLTLNYAGVDERMISWK